MNKVGSAGDNVLTWNFAYILFGVVFFALMFWWVVGIQDGAAMWQDFYAKEIARVVNGAEPGQEVYLDIKPITGIARENNVGKNEIFRFDSRDNTITVRLTRTSSTGFSYFNDVLVDDVRVELFEDGFQNDRLYFKIYERRINDNE